MNKIKEYLLIKDSYTSIFNEKVNRAIGTGYQPIGKAAVSPSNVWYIEMVIFEESECKDM